MPISSRVQVIFIFIVSLVLIGAYVGFTFFFAAYTKHAYAHELSSLSDVIGATSRAALAFRDPDAALRIIQGVFVRGDIAHVRLASEDGKTLAELGKPVDKNSLTTATADSVAWTLRDVTVHRPIKLEDDVVGYLTLTADLENLYHNAFYLVGTGFVLFLVFAGCVILISKRFTEWVTSPVTFLGEAVGRVAKTEDLSERLEESEEPTINNFSLIFNNLLEQLQERNRSLREAKERAESATKAKSIFVAQMSHELRTPLHAILGMTDEVLALPLSSEQKSLLEIVASSGRSLLSIINDILDFSKIEVGKLELKFEPVQLRDFFQKTQRMLEHSFRAKGVDLSVSLSSDIPVRILADPGRLSQILVNLLGNSLKFTPPGGEVTISAGLSQNDRNTVIVSVRDTGIGIPARHLTTIFEPFTQVERVVVTKEGTGLGLAIASRLVKLMKGAIWAESSEGKGSTFFFTFMFEEASLPTAPFHDMHSRTGSSWPREESSGESIGLENLSVLVVEDNKVNQKLVERFLSTSGCSVKVMSNGQECLDMLAKERFDIVLMDVNMPIMDGFEATRHIRGRELSTGTHLPIIALTANATDEDKRQCLEAGMDEFLSKPLDKVTLIKKIREIVNASAKKASQTHETLSS